MIPLMTVESYLRNRAAAQLLIPSSRKYCSRCQKPLSTCYCETLHPFAPRARFVILIHPLERWRGIATGRMAHLSLSNSLLIEGVDFSQHPQVKALLDDPAKSCFVLAPGIRSVDLSRMTEPERLGLLPPEREPVIFVIDGTWSQARQMLRKSVNLQSLPRLCFSPSTPSGFLVRKQPAAHCYSTIEAIHTCLRLLGDPQTERHDQLLVSFSFMVEQQRRFEVVNGARNGFRALRGVRPPAS